MSDAYADACAHKRFCNIRDARERFSEVVIGKPTRNHGENRAGDERYEQALRHARKRRDEIAFRQGF